MEKSYRNLDKYSNLNEFKETNLKEKFRVALNSTAKVIADDFELNKKTLRDKRTKDLVSIEIDDITTPSDFIRLRAETDLSALKRNFQMI